jgi:hypothetical protein
MNNYTLQGLEGGCHVEHHGNRLHRIKRGAAVVEILAQRDFRTWHHKDPLVGVLAVVDDWHDIGVSGCRVGCTDQGLSVRGRSLLHQLRDSLVAGLILDDVQVAESPVICA